VRVVQYSVTIRAMAEPENYTPGCTATAVDFMERRTAESHAGFVLPLLRPGLRLLDCGCGPGSITVGLARSVAPSEVVGIDAGGAQLDRARDRARAADVPASFREASVYALPFHDGEFDASFAHALFEHLAEPLRALGEIRRILKRGGFVALRSPDWGGFVLHPWSVEIASAVADYQAMQRANGGEIHAGRKLGSWLRAAGFERTMVSASYELYPDSCLIAEYLAQQLDTGKFRRAATILRDWAQTPDALFAQAWFEATGWRLETES
jgi:SAM-dependent methyltransferase